jgi:hypothetical protein
METTKTMTTVTPDELIQKLAIAAVEIYILCGESGSDEVEAFKEAIPLIECAWELSDEQAAEAVALIERQFEAVEKAPADDMESVFDEKLLLNTTSGGEILAVLWGLIETAIRLERREDREKIVHLIDYLKDFWDLAEHIAF